MAEKFEIIGMKELEKTLKKLETLPQKCVTRAVKKGATIAQKAAKRGGWVDDTGNMRRGIVLKGEKTRVKGKKVYEVTMNKSMNELFQKKTVTGMTRSTNKAGTRKVVYYYPASQEYGFRTRSGGYIPGFHFLRDGLEDNELKIKTEIVSVLSKEIDKLK